MQQLKIVTAHYKYSIQGGPERYMFKFKELAEKNGCTVIPFSVNYPQNVKTEYSEYFVSPGKSKKSGTSHGLTVSSAFKGVVSLFHNREAYKKMKALLRAEKPDLVYVLIPGMLSADIFKAAKEENVPVILRLSDFRLICGKNILMRGGNICEECIYGNYKCMVKHKCVKNSFILSVLRAASCGYARRKGLYNLVDAVITPPKFTKNKILQSGFFEKEKVFTNPTFIDCNSVTPVYTHKNYVLCLGRFSPEKGFIYVVRALRYLKDIPVTVAVTGEKENCNEELKKAIAELGLEDKVEFLGFLQGEKLKNATENALCVAAPAIWYENMPNVVIEAYAYGKPVIASRLGSLEEMVEDGKTGILFEPKNEKDIADCIRRLYDSPELCRELGENARKKCETEYSPEQHWKRFTDIYNSIKQGGEKI